MTAKPPIDADTATHASIARMTDEERDALAFVRRMLEAIHGGDAEAYAAMCDEDVSCFETDVAPYRIDTLTFHTQLVGEMKRLGAYSTLVRADLLTPRVQIYGDAAVVTYTRLMTYAEDGRPHWARFNETRVLVRRTDGWKMVHFHRSDAG
jgi:ketosteroid isomerase-like protein